VTLQYSDLAQMGNYILGPYYFKALWPNSAGPGFASYSRAFAVINPTKDFETVNSEYPVYQNSSPFFPEGAGSDSSNGGNGSIGEPVPTTAAPTTTSVVGTASQTPATMGVVGAASSDGGGLSTGAIIGIGVGCGVAGLALIALLVWFLLHRRRQSATMNTLASYDTDRHRPENLITAEKEASAGVDGSPHSPYSDDGVIAGPANGSLYEGSMNQPGAVIPAAAAAAVAPHRLHPQQQQQQYHQQQQQQHQLPPQQSPTPPEQARSYTPYSDRPSGHLGSPSTHTASVVHSDDASRVNMSSPIPGRATPHGVSAQYAHLVEEGMTEPELRRLEEEERQLDAAIEQATRHPG
jgi:hypothetical protein